MPIDLLTLRLLVAVVEVQSVARAAGREHIAASAVSKRIAAHLARVARQEGPDAVPLVSGRKR